MRAPSLVRLLCDRQLASAWKLQGVAMKTKPAADQQQHDRSQHDGRVGPGRKGDQFRPLSHLYMAVLVTTSWIIFLMTEQDGQRKVAA